MVVLNEAPKSAEPTPEKTIVDRLRVSRDDVSLLGRVRVESAREIEVAGCLEYLSQSERIEFFNHAYFILVPGGKLYVTVPYHSHPRSFAHPEIQWPPFSEHSFLFLDRQWREMSPDRAVSKLNCDFPGPPVMTYSYGYNERWSTRSTEALAFAVEHYGGVVVELYVALTKR